jgi:tRNA (mo5U34)-methyltransferase
MDSWSPPRSIQIAGGLGAGDVGDELLCRGFWDALPPGACLEVEWLPGGPAPAPGSHDPRHLYVPAAVEGASRPALPGLLVGTSPRAETMGSDAFLRFLAPRLDAFHDAGQPVDALGVGFESPGSSDAREAFRRSFLPIRSWSVVSSRSRDVLRELGVAEERIVLGADWAWSYRLRDHPQAWASSTWRELGIDAAAPLLVVNAPSRVSAPDARALAVALDRLSSSHGFQVAFFCSDARDDSGSDHAAARQVMALMERPSVLLPVIPYTPDQVHALLAAATTAVSARHQFTLQCVRAGTHVVVVGASVGLRGLCEDLDVEPVPVAGGLDADRLVEALTPPDRARCAALLQDARRRLEARAANNLVLWAGATGWGVDPRPRAALVERMSGMIWYHRMELAPGVVTPGHHWEDLWGPIRRRHREVDFQGKSVLEVGCWDGYWSFEAERLGAAEVLATDDLSQRRTVTRTVPFAIECLGSRVRYRDDVSVYELPERLQRTFDVVVFYGVLYHLRYPALALAKLRRVLATGGLLLLETAVLPDEDEPLMRWGYRAVYPTDPSSWNAVSLSCLRDLLETSYFEVELCETFLRTGRVGRGYARARAVDRLEPDPHPVPDHFLKDVATSVERDEKLVPIPEKARGR